jgi:glycosyltransferase involved in cell wall biosynthesis
MKIAFVDNLPVGGGLSRYSLGLCKNLINQYPNLVIDYYIHDYNVNRMQELFLIERLKVIVLSSTKKASKTKFYSIKILSKLGIDVKTDKTIKEIEKCITGKYDVAYFPTAHMMKRPNLSIPIVGTFHDFNWKYFFGSAIFDSSFVQMMEVETMKWFENGENITLSNFTHDEARKLFSSANNFPQVIHIGPLAVYSTITTERSNEILKDLKIDFPYIIYPGNFFPHKNHLNLFTAFNLLKQKKGFENYKLLLTGAGSDQIKFGIAEYRGVKLTTDNDYDVRGMGYQSNEQMDALIMNAKLMVSPSIYEEMCQPAMDAWSFGTPTALSDIPPFREHENVLGIKSAFFDPMNPFNIAEVLEQYLSNYDKAKSDGNYSKHKMAENTWEIVTKKYMDIFEKAIKRSK